MPDVKRALSEYAGAAQGLSRSSGACTDHERSYVSEAGA